jgi:hypothetical protein
MTNSFSQENFNIKAGQRLTEVELKTDLLNKRVNAIDQKTTMLIILSVLVIILNIQTAPSLIAILLKVIGA